MILLHDHVCASVKQAILDVRVNGIALGYRTILVSLGSIPSRSVEHMVGRVGHDRESVAGSLIAMQLHVYIISKLRVVIARLLEQVLVGILRGEEREGLNHDLIVFIHALVVLIQSSSLARHAKVVVMAELEHPAEEHGLFNIRLFVGCGYHVPQPCVKDFHVAIGVPLHEERRVDILVVRVQEALIDVFHELLLCLRVAKVVHDLVNQRGVSP